MNKKIHFDHTFTMDPGHRFFKSLSKKGFVLSKYPMEHPGEVFCEFIMFESLGTARFAYLEFIWQKAKAKYKIPGLSFRFDDNLEGLYKRLLKKDLDATFVHKNYEWKSNDKERLPGWNFLDLKNSPIRSIKIWFTEYEPWPKIKLKSKPPKVPKHPNGITHILGLDLNLNDKGREHLGLLLGGKIRATATLPDGFRLHINPSRSNRLSSVILGCKSLSKANQYLKTEVTTYQGVKALRLRNTSGDPKMPDYVIIEEPLPKK